MGDAEQRILPQRLVDDVAEETAVTRIGAQALPNRGSCWAIAMKRWAIASDICTTAVLKNVPCTYHACSSTERHERSGRSASPAASLGLRYAVSRLRRSMCRSPQHLSALTTSVALSTMSRRASGVHG